MDKETFLTNYKKVRQECINACEKSGRNIDEILILPVSKTKPINDLEVAYDLGIKTFGENYVQELVEKIDALKDEISWHMIGHLQRNKVKYIVGKVDLIHSVDSIKLAKQIDDQSKKVGVITNILAEVNIANEENKIGFTKKEDLLLFAKEVSKMSNIRLKGLMTSAPYVLDPEENRKYFKKMKMLCVDIEQEKLDNISMKTLSMGMTNDFSIAIEEGATIVRIGTALFGDRYYK